MNTCMSSPTQITNIIHGKIKELAPLDYRDIFLWLDRVNWILPIPGDTNLPLINLSAKWLQEQVDDPRNQLINLISSAYASAKADGQVPSSEMNDRQVPSGPPASASKADNKKAQHKPDNKKAQHKPEQEQPRQDYDDETLTQLVLDLLRENRFGEYTYNQVADEASIWCDFKGASRVLRRLESRGNDVIEFTVKKPNGGKVKVYKYAPERKALDKNYSLAEEIVGAVVIEYLEDRGAQTQNAICQAMREYFGYLDKAIVKEVLESLRSKDRLDENVGPRNARMFSVVNKKATALHFDTHLSGVVGTCRELSEGLVGS